MKMNKKMLSAACIALVGVAALMPLDLTAVTPGGIPKKFIGLTFDVMNTSPSNVLANADRFAASVPFLDGVGLSIGGVPVVKENGSVVTSELAMIMHPTDRWTRDAVKDRIPILKAISQKPNLRESFLLFWMTPRKKSDRLNWADDKAWANYAENMATVAWLAKEGGMKGLMLDPEEYAVVPQYVWQQVDPDYATTAKLARQRGREVFSRVFKEFPDAVIFSLWMFWRHAALFSNGNPTDPLQISNDEGELLTHYFNGMLDVIPPGARFVDGAEHYSLTATKDQYIKDAFTQQTRALGFVEPENRAKYRAQHRVGNTIYLDMFAIDQNPKNHWYHKPVNGSRLEHFRLNIEQALTASGEYVWIYGEHAGNLFDWSGNWRKSKPTWESVIPGMTETLLLAKDPEKHALRRKAELAAKGELKNLLPDAAGPFKFFAPKHRYINVDEVSSLKGVIPGERYIVSQAYKGASREDSPEISVFWRRNGKLLENAKPTKIEYELGVFPWMTKRRAVVTVPEGADELFIAAKAKMNPTERVEFGATEIFLLDPSPKRFPATGGEVKRSSLKSVSWKYDAKAKVLTDGVWKLQAEPVAKGSDELAVTKFLSGEGVLDFTDSKRTSGFSVVRLGGMSQAPVTDVIAPDAREVSTFGFIYNKTLRSIVLSPRLTALGFRCFESATNLVSVVPTHFPEVVSFDRGSQFMGCTSLVGDFSFPNLTTSLSGKMFAKTKITSVRLPKAPTVGWQALSGCENLKAVEFGIGCAYSNETDRVKCREEALKAAGALRNLSVTNRKKPLSFYMYQQTPVGVDSQKTSVKVEPGALYYVGASVKTRGVAFPRLTVTWKKDGAQVRGFDRRVVFNGMREENRWRTGFTAIRVPADADELVLSATGALHTESEVEFRDLEVFRIGDPLPVWIDRASLK